MQDVKGTTTSTIVAEGPIGGVRSDGVTAFLGVPYAAPPFGALRFRAPQPHQPWTEQRDCSTYGPTVPKPPYIASVADLLPEPVVAGEDCLNLNVWTPDVRPAGLPVFVWVHGGAFQNGSGAVPVYDGSAFARDGVVAVTINYRLGVEGFGHFPDALDNRGLLDQIAALQWVRDNIAAFGGDPGRVTIGGESAGAMSVTTLTAMPAARGLFHRVIAQSGAGHHALRPATAATVTAALAEQLGVEPTAHGFAAVAPDALVAAHAELNQQIALAGPDPARWGEITVNGMTMEPVIDGDSLPGLPYQVIAAGDGAEVDLLIGSNDDEHALFLYPVLDGLTEAGTRATLTALGAADAYDVIVDRTGTTSPGRVMVAGMTDFFFRIPALRLAEAQTGATHVYEFGWRTPVLDGVLGACHALEIAFAFDTLGEPAGRGLVGEDPPQALADAMHAAWVGFVRDGDPGWPAYGDQRLTRRFGGDRDGEVVADPEPQRREVWSGRR